jgi:hypothetical protein
LAVSACGDKRTVAALQIPQERIDCVTIRDQRPTIPPEYVIDWSKVTTIAKAQTEHEAFVTRLREREKQVTVYVVKLEGQLFACANDAQWIADYQSRLPKP